MNSEQPSSVWPGLKGRRVLVTGAGSGIGRAVALALGRSGASVGLHYHASAGGAGETAAAIDAAGGQAWLLRGDLADTAVRDRLVDDFVAVAGGLDVLVNNAGIVADYADFRELSEAAWLDTFAVNVQAPFWLCRAAWPHLAAAGGGRIINISSAAVGFGGSARNMHYTASKAALEGLTIALAKEGAPVGILVNAIRCGLIESGMHLRVPGYDEERYRRRAAEVPLGRAGRPEEVAAMVAVLASEEGGFITGQVIAIAGGD
ncbi:MAG: SDR family oxidoreductase [Alphaproteobacteria bacterium]